MNGARWNRIYAIVRKVPKGRVATYGQIAFLAGLKGHARQVGYALNALPDGSSVPWHRVINAQGKVSARADPAYVVIQQRLLEAEGVEFGVGNRISLKRFGWKPTGRGLRVNGQGRSQVSQRQDLAGFLRQSAPAQEKEENYETGCLKTKGPGIAGPGL
jgi:methylated-DNA-protein-cysteine methyltransferase-like protein